MAESLSYDDELMQNYDSDWLEPEYKPTIPNHNARLAELERNKSKTKTANN